MALAREALDDFTATRGREGEKLAEMIVDRVNAMRDIVRKVVPRIPEAQALFTEKLRQRLTEALGNASDDRILQEVAVFATRIDVAEELTRLNTHLDEVERVLKQGGACGKRLDFLMQELNREANTLGSKSAITEVSQASMELKLLIEQMREQIQNLEWEPSPERLNKFRKYSDFPEEIGSRFPLPDLVLVDGRFRVACALKALRALQDQTDWLLLVDDYVNRSKYHELPEFGVLQGYVGRMAVFSGLQDSAKCRLDAAISRYETDPS
jgi:archaellum component FlaC